MARPETGPAEDDLDRDRSGEQGGERQAGELGDRPEAGAQGVRPEDAAFRQPARARRLHERFAEPLEYRRAHEARRGGGGGQSDRGRRQRQVPGEVEAAAPEAESVGVDGAHRSGRKERQRDREGGEQHQSEPEGRQRPEGERQGAQSLVDPRARPRRRGDAERESESELDEEGRGRKQERVRSCLAEDLADRPMLAEGVAPFAARHAADPAQVLLRERPVEAVDRAQAEALLLGNARILEGGPGLTREEAEEEEDRGEDDPAGEQRRREPGQERAGHGSTGAARRCHSGRLK